MPLCVTTSIVDAAAHAFQDVNAYYAVHLYELSAGNDKLLQCL